VATSNGVFRCARYPLVELRVDDEEALAVERDRRRELQLRSGDPGADDALAPLIGQADRDDRLGGVARDVEPIAVEQQAVACGHRLPADVDLGDALV